MDIPYIIKIILGEVAKSGRLSDIQRIVSDKDTILEALFKRTYGTLSSAAKRIFLTLSSWHSTIPLLALESVILRSDNEKIDVDKAVDELNKSSFVELLDIQSEPVIYVPLVAAIFGRRELEVSPDKLKIMQDKRLLMEFGAGTSKGISNIVTHIERKIKAVAQRVKTAEELIYELPTLECLANKFNEAWLQIAELEADYGLYDRQIESYRTYLQKCPDNQKKLTIWNSIAEISHNMGNWDSESAALAEVVCNPLVEYYMVSNVANRINKYYSLHTDSNEAAFKRILIDEVIRIMTNRIKEANAMDCSRLAWLYLNTNNEIKALQYAKMGLKLDETNNHCWKLVDKLSNSIIN